MFVMRISTCSPVSTSSCFIRKFRIIRELPDGWLWQRVPGSIKPLGFSLDEKHVRRTGLDYWAKVDLHVWDSLEELKQAAAPGAQFWYLSTKAPRSHWDAVFHAGDYLVFGPESRGLPESMLREHADTALTIPMPGEGARSLNLSTAVAVVLYEGLRQTGI